MQIQYIGARYVPVWYENTNDQSANWQSNVEYEPLTFVTTTNNHLYLSKKTVPDTIGNPADNITYWLDMGLFTNAQIAQLQAQVDNIEDVIIPTLESDLNARITSIDPYEKFRNKKICVLGDSISAYSTLPNNWVKMLTDFMANYDCEVTNLSEDGQSLAGLKQYIDNSQVTIPNADYYILFLGLNDWQGSNNWGWTSGSYPVQPAMVTVDQAIKLANPNAKYFFISPLKFFVSVTINNNHSPLCAYRQFYEKWFSSKGYTVLSGFNIGELCAENVAQYTLDGLHPNSFYAKIMFEYVLDGLVSERSNITAPQQFRRNLSNTLSATSIISEQINDQYVTYDIEAYSWSPTTGQYIDIMDAPNLITGNPIFDTLDTTMCQFRVYNGKLQAYFFISPPNYFKAHLSFIYGLQDNN